ncbi:MAG TPA: NAD-dependent epimerase/dehydratase family protein [Ensifer sp.]|nr:NAD-dependent epimerase/dehydratase family protein [Ensifer sp.]
MILVTGATGFLGKRVCRLLAEKEQTFVRTSQSLGLDLRDRSAVMRFFEQVRPDYVLNCAAYVGGIEFGRKHPVELFQNNLQMSLNLLEAAHSVGVKRLVNPISNCAYPGAATLFKEDEFWDGPLHESVMVYGFVRKAFWVGSWAYRQQFDSDIINIILSNMYGPEDHFEAERSHALGALVMKIVEAKRNNAPEVVVWGSGKPVREWLYVDDGAEAMWRALSIPKTTDPINIGIGRGISIIDLATMIKEAAGYQGKLVLDESKPDGAPYKTVDGSRGKEIFAWSPERDFRRTVAETVGFYETQGRAVAL